MIDRDVNFKTAVGDSNTNPHTGRINGQSAFDCHVASFKRQVHGMLGHDLAAVEARLEQSLSSQYDVVNQICGRSASMGGKRMRPMLVLLCARVGGHQRTPDAQQAADLTSIAVAVELVHAASLVHDDVLDEAMERRHQATVVQKSGNAAAVLLGDYLFTRGYAVAAGCRSTLPARQIAEAATQLCEGELRQQASSAVWDLSLKDYRSILLQKTGARCQVSCRLGAWRAGAGTDPQRAMSRFGRYLGLAFQIFDDWLDYWGTDQVGKTLGTDLQQLKPTLPLLRLLTTCEPSQRREVIRMLGRGGDEALAEIRRQLAVSDAGEYTLTAARRCAQNAKSAVWTSVDSCQGLLAGDRGF